MEKVPTVYLLPFTGYRWPPTYEVTFYRKKYKIACVYAVREMLLLRTIEHIFHQKRPWKAGTTVFFPTSVQFNEFPKSTNVERALFCQSKPTSSLTICISVIASGSCWVIIYIFGYEEYDGGGRAPISAVTHLGIRPGGCVSLCLLVPV